MERRKVEALYPLSPQQRGMLFESLARPRSGIFVEQMSCELAGELDPAAFERAWAWVIGRHAVLRTGFAWRGEAEPVQAVLSGVEVPLQLADWRDLPEAGQEDRLETWLAEDRRQGFDLSRPPLMRLALFRTGESTHRFVWSHHHILMDGWCQPVVLRELLAAYRALLRGEEPRAAPVRPYRDYVAWLAGRDLGEAESFWRHNLEGFTRPARLGSTRRALPLPPGQPPYGEVRRAIPAAEWETLRSLARRHRLTGSALVAGAWALLLSRLSGEPDVVFGVTLSGRPADLSGVESMIGLFISTLPLRLAVPASGPLWPWLAEVQERLQEISEHQHCTAGQVHGWSGVPAGLRLFDSILVYENYPAGLADLEAGLVLRPKGVRTQGGQTRHALTILVNEGEGLAFQMVRDRRRLADDDAERIAGRLMQILSGFAAEAQPEVEALLAGVAAGETPGVLEEASGLDLPRTFVPPRSPLEEALAAIWEEVLEVAPVGIHDSFFELGGHSLLASLLLARVREAFAVELPLASLFETPTVAGLAAAVAAREGVGGGLAEALAALPPIVPAPAERHLPFPLTDIQEAYWIGRSGIFELGEVATHGYSEFATRGLDLERFGRAWRRLIERHDMLRAILLPDGRQRILASVLPYEIAVLDLRGRSPEEIAAALEAVRREMSHQVLPADRWPLFDVRVSRLDDGRGWLHLSLDALIADAWSFSILRRELAVLYRDPEASLPPLDLSFRDYVLAERALAGTEIYRRAEAYWKGRLAELPPTPEIPLARSPGALARPRFERRSGSLSPADWRRLRERVARWGVTPSSLLLAAFSEVLAAWSKSPRFTLNLTLFNRLPLHPGVDALVGDFTTLTLLEVDASPGGSFEERVRRVQRRLWEDLDHRLFGGVRVLRELARLRGEPTAAAMPVVFTSTLVHGAAGEPELDWLGELTHGISQTPQVWLDHQVGESGGALIYQWDAVEELFPPGLLDAMFDAYGQLLARLAAGEEPLPAYAPPQGEVTAEAAAGLLHSRIQEQVLQSPEAPAVIAPDRILTYGELDREADRAARWLSAHGARAERLVAIVMEKGWEQAVAALAVLRAGAAFLPVDPDLPAARFVHLLTHGEVGLALTQARIEGGLPWPARVERLAIDQPADEHEAALPAPRPQNLAYVIYTSGSTGLPKGVMIEHWSALNTVADVNRRFAVSTRDRVLALSAFSFDLSIYDLFGVLGAGGAVVLPDPRRLRDPAHWTELVRHHGVTLWNSVPALAELWVHHLAGRPEAAPPTLRLAMLSGDWIPVSLPDRLRALLPGLEVVSLGGATEASIWSILHPIGEVDPAWRSIPYGRAMDSQRVEVLDEALSPRPDWVPGQIYIAGAGLARGYWRDEEKTRQSFLTDPATGERLYRTGDLGRRLPDGTIEFLGREDLQVKVQGYRIELGEIEAAIAEHPRVRAAVAGIAGDRHGPKQLLAWVLPEPGGEALASEELRVFLERRLPAYMLPSIFIPIDALPLTANGKVDRRALRVPAAAPQPSHRPAAPSETAAEIARLAAEVLGIEAVEPDADLLSLGATSIDLIRLANLLERRFGLRPDLADLYREATPAALAGKIGRAAPAAVPGLLSEPHEREAFKQRQPGLRRDGDNKESTPLPEAEPIEELRARALARKSHRRFRSEPVPLERLARLLGCLRQVSLPDGPKYLYGSAGGLYPVQTYLHAGPGTVGGLSTGVHYYHPAEHRLVLLSPGVGIDAGIHTPFVNRPLFEQSAFSLFLIARLGAVAPLYGDDALHFATLEAGLMSQLLETTAPVCGLGLCQIGRLDFERIRALFLLDDSSVLVHSLLGGPVAGGAPRERPAVLEELAPLAAVEREEGEI